MTNFEKIKKLNEFNIDVATIPISIKFIELLIYNHFIIFEVDIPPKVFNIIVDEVIDVKHEASKYFTIEEFNTCVQSICRSYQRSLYCR